MILCLLFGHKPHPTYEHSRVTMGSISRRYTFCTRCDQAVSEDATGFPIPSGSITKDERDAVLIDSLIDRLVPLLLPHTLKRRRAKKKPIASPALTEERE